MHPRRQFLIALTLAVLGCGGGGRNTSSGGSRGGSAAPADIAAMRALLERYSPTGTWILRSADSLPSKFTVGGRTITLSSTGEFGRYFDDSAPENLVGYMSTAVHEVYHAITSRLGYHLLVESRASDLVDVEGVYVGGPPLLVRFSLRYPAREMESTFPRDARSFRYPTYINPSGDTNSTQTDGVFGLVDEWAAYLHSARTVLDFWPWIRDEAPKTAAVYVDYRSGMAGMWLAGAEFKLYILHYLVHARQHRPDVYSALMANESFRRAFVAIDDAWAALVHEGAQLDPAIASLDVARGASTVSYPDHDEAPAVRRYLASEPYVTMAAELRR